jgi:uncharacterized protein
VGRTETAIIPACWTSSSLLGATISRPQRPGSPESNLRAGPRTTRGSLLFGSRGNLAERASCYREDDLGGLDRIRIPSTPRRAKKTHLNDLATPPSPAVATRSTTWRVLGLAGLVTIAVTALSHLLPADWSGSAVGICFMWVSYALVVRNREERQIQHFGLSFGGLFEPLPIDWRRVIRETTTALLWAFGVAAIVFPPFLIGFLGWWRPALGFVAAPLGPVLNDAPGQLMLVALPEEAFYRGYLQTALDDRWKGRLRLLGGHLSIGIVVSSAIFALGHLLTEPQPNRLAVFFPALVFGWLRTRTRGVGAGIVFHALCNLYSGYLGRSFGIWH